MLFENVICEKVFTKIESALDVILANGIRFRVAIYKPHKIDSIDNGKV